MKRSIVILLLFAMVGFILTAAGQTESKGQTALEPIKIGILYPRSGSLALIGEEALQGCLAAIDQVNARGGINGRQIVPVVADIPDTTAAQNETNRLIQKEGIKILTGTYSSALGSVVATVANRNGAYFLENIAVADSITDRGLKGIFRSHFNGTGMGIGAIDFVQWLAKKANLENKNVKIALMYENSDFGMSTGRSMAAHAKELGMQVVVDESYSKDLPDTSPLVLKAKNANANFMVLTPYINDGINFVRMSKNLNYNPVAFVGLGTGFGLDVFWETLKEDAQGMFDADPLETPYFDSMAANLVEPYKEFEKIHMAKTGHAPLVVSMLGWQATWVLLNDIIAKVEDPNNIDQLIEATRAVDYELGQLPTGHGLKFDQNGQNTRTTIGGMQWQDGVKVGVYPEVVATHEMVKFPFPGWGK